MVPSPGSSAAARTDGNPTIGIGEANRDANDVAWVKTRVVTGATCGGDQHASRRHQTEESHTPVTTETSGAAAIRPFEVDIPEEALEDLRRRIAATRWPSKELVADRSQGVQLATIQALAGY